MDGTTSIEPKYELLARQAGERVELLVKHTNETGRVFVFCRITNDDRPDWAPRYRIAFWVIAGRLGNSYWRYVDLFKPQIISVLPALTEAAR